MYEDQQKSNRESRDVTIKTYMEGLEYESCHYIFQWFTSLSSDRKSRIISGSINYTKYL